MQDPELFKDFESKVNQLHSLDPLSRRTVEVLRDYFDFEVSEVSLLDCSVVPGTLLIRLPVSTACCVCVLRGAEETVHLFGRCSITWFVNTSADA